MKFCFLCVIIICSYSMTQHLQNNSEIESEAHRISMIVDIITLNLKKNGWCTILCLGNLPDEFYIRMQRISYPFVITSTDREDEEIEDVVPYRPNSVIINLEHIAQYDDIILKLKSSPYWHPLVNVVLYYHQEDHDILAKLYFSLWYYNIINAIIVQYDDTRQVLLISHYTPYITEDFKLNHLYGCWTTRKLDMPISGFEEGFTCENGCHNVSLHSKLRANNLGTCIGFSKITVPYNDSNVLKYLSLFDDKSKNLHGYAFRTYVTEIRPFLVIDDNINGSYTLRNRDGIIWSSMANLMNFSIDLTPSVNIMKKNFNFEINIHQIFDLARRKADLFFIPVYLFDLIIVDVDTTFPFKESGVCILSHRADFDTTLVSGKTLRDNRSVIVQFMFCFLLIWVTFSIFQGVEKRSLSFDQIGKDLLNAFRNMLLINLCNPPRWRSFRIFLAVSMWSFFIINFASQAIIISVFTAVKRGKEVDTFDDVIDKGYSIYAMSSPDLILPDTEEKFRIINSKLIPELDLFECVRNMTHDKHRFCLIDCAVARYLERNKLNEHGEQYLHVARQDRMHSHYLSMILGKHSPLTERFNKFMMIFYEAGLIMKWEQYRYANIKEETTAKPLGMKDFKSFFHVYCFSVVFISFIFILELFIFNVNKFR